MFQEAVGNSSSQLQDEEHNSNSVLQRVVATKTNSFFMLFKTNVKKKQY